MDYSVLSNFGIAPQGGAYVPSLTMPSQWSGQTGFRLPNGQPLDPSAAGGAQGFGFNMPTAQLGLQGIMGLGNLFMGLQANRLAKDQFNFTKDMTNTNLNNQITSYNTALADRARSRAVIEGRDQASADAWVEKNKMTR